MTGDAAYRELAQRLVNLEALVAGFSKSQLAHSSMENTGLPTYNGAGQLAGMIGRLPDGSYGSATMTGPVPPTPSAPQVEVVRGIGLKIVWDGTFAVATDVVPLEGGRLEVYVSPTSDITPVMVPRYTVESPRGGEMDLSVGYGTPYFVAFAYRASSGKISPASPVVGPFTVERATAEDLDVDFDELRGTKIFYGPAEPVTAKADLWLRDPTPPSNLYTAWRFNPDLDEWVLLKDQGIVQALQDAATANQAAEEAGLAALAAQGTADGAAGAAGDAQDTADAANAAAAAAAQAAFDAAQAAEAAHDQADAAASAAATAQTKANEADAAALAAAGIANSKGRVYYQTSAPSPGDVYGLWIDIDDGNKPYRYVANTWSQVENASVQAAATAASNAQTTATNAATAASNAAQAAATADQKAVDAAAAAVAASNLAASKAKVFNQTSAPTTGMSANDVWHDTDDGNRRYVYIGNPLTWTAQQLGASGISATARQLGAITTFRQASAPTTGMVTGDFWIDADDNVIYRYEGAWVKSQDIAINTAITNAATAQATADGKMRIFAQASPPAGLVAGDVGDLWIDTDDDNVSYTWALLTGTTYGWQKRQLGNGAIVPNSLIASNVIATGTVTASLLEALLVLTNEIIAGNPLGDHARMTPTGFRVFKNDPVDGVPDEVVRMGTETNDYFGVVDSAGQLVASIDDTGRGNFTELTASKMFVGGRDVEGLVGDKGGTVVGRFLENTPFEIGPIFLRYGIAEAAATVVAGRTYDISIRCTWKANVANDECRFQLVMTTGANGNTTAQAPAPTVNGNLLAPSYATGHVAGRWYTHTASTKVNMIGTTNIRVLLAIERGAGSQLGTIALPAGNPVEIIITDLGPTKPNSGGWSTGGGTPSGGTASPPPANTAQQYFVDLAPAGWESVRGNGSIRAGNEGVTQGYDPSGFNGNGKGRWWFPLPSITGTIDRMDLFLYSEHWYYNSGGTAIINVAPYLNPWAKPRGDFLVHGMPKPGGREFMLPTDWYPFFRNSGANGFNRADGITVGPGNGTDLAHYGRFSGPAARLRIYYTQ